MTQLLINIIGGVGIILLGMKLMSGGLKTMAGGALRSLLSKWTDTPMRGVITGFCITSAVQSSSAVTVATIGFVNAGLMTLTQVIWVIYGSNIGTTTTAWIVAFLGLKINVKLFALPFIGLGMGLLITGHGSRRAALGEALAGFGLFFIGVETMQAAFQGANLPIQNLAGTGILGTIIFLGIGVVLTFLMQSSSGAMALILTAVAGGFVSINAAAAAVIGANIGTTTTGLLAVIGATPNAKRVAGAHLVFNVITGLVALLILPLLLGFIFLIRNWLELTLDPASVLAVFHTVFNILGVVLLWKFTPRLIRFLESKFRTAEEDESRPKHLDDAVARTPALAVNALILEVQRTGLIAKRMALTALTSTKAATKRLATDNTILESLIAAIGEFATQARKEGLNQESSEFFPEILRAGQYFNVTAEKALAASSVLPSLPPDTSQEIQQLMTLKNKVNSLLINLAQIPLEEAQRQTAVADFEKDYQTCRKALLRAGGTGDLTVEQMIDALDFANHLEAMTKQLLKGWSVLTLLMRQTELEKKSPAGKSLAPTSEKNEA